MPIKLLSVNQVNELVTDFRLGLYTPESLVKEAVLQMVKLNEEYCKSINSAICRDATCPNRENSHTEYDFHASMGECVDRTKFNTNPADSILEISEDEVPLTQNSIWSRVRKIWGSK